MYRNKMPESTISQFLNQTNFVTSMKIKIYLWLCFSCIATFASAQNQITGTVIDEEGLPLPGANVIIRNTTQGTVTDFDGKFSLEASPEDVLLISYIGYIQKEVTVGDRTEINVTLSPDTESLDEVVVVGYGTQKKSVVTGAISSIKESDLENLPITRVE